MFLVDAVCCGFVVRIALVVEHGALQLFMLELVLDLHALEVANARVLPHTQVVRLLIQVVKGGAQRVVRVIII